MQCLQVQCADNRHPHYPAVHHTPGHRPGAEQALIFPGGIIRTCIRVGRVGHRLPRVSPDSRNRCSIAPITREHIARILPPRPRLQLSDAPGPLARVPPAHTTGPRRGDSAQAPPRRSPPVDRPRDRSVLCLYVLGELRLSRSVVAGERTKPPFGVPTRGLASGCGRVHNGTIGAFISPPRNLPGTRGFRTGAAEARSGLSVARGLTMAGAYGAVNRQDEGVEPSVDASGEPSAAVSPPPKDSPEERRSLAGDACLAGWSRSTHVRCGGMRR